MKHETTRALHDYWNELRKGRRAPLRLEVDPGAIASILGNAFVLERLDAATYRYRLAGTRVCGYHGRELRGTSFTELWPAAERETMTNLLYTVTEDAAGAVIGYSGYAARERKTPFEILLLPLARDNGMLDRIIGTACPLSSPAWLGNLPVQRLEIRSLRLVWPDGVPLLPAADAASHAEAVPSPRPRFRLIEGGLR